MIVQAYFLKFNAFLEKRMPLSMWSKVIYKTRLPRPLRHALEDFRGQTPGGSFRLLFVEQPDSFDLRLECFSRTDRPDLVLQVSLGGDDPAQQSWFLHPGYVLAERYPMTSCDAILRRSRLPGELRDLLSSRYDAEDSFSLHMTQDDTAAALIYSSWDFEGELLQRRVFILGYREHIRTAILVPQADQRRALRV